jgi:capsular polysaccharide biosynthesis protein
MAVELSDYMRRVLKWSWLIAVVTVAGGVIALLLTSQSSTSFVTTATVAPPGDVATAAQAQQYVNDFQAAAGSRAVQEAVTTDTEVARGTVAERVTVNRVGDSGLVSVTYRTPVRDDPNAEKIVQSVVDNTLSLMYESRVNAAQRGVDAADVTIESAQGDVAAAQARVDEFLAARGFVAPTAALQSVQDQITSFEISEVAARASGNVAGANTFAIALAELREQQSALGKDAGAFTALQDEVDSAKSQVVRAQEARETAVRDAAEVKPEGNYNFGRKNEAQDRAATIWRRTLAVMLACFVLSILLVAWLASLTPEAEAAPAEAEADADAEAEAEPEPEPDAVLVPAEDDSARPGRRSSRYREPKRDPDGITLGIRPT